MILREFFRRHKENYFSYLENKINGFFPHSASERVKIQALRPVPLFFYCWYRYYFTGLLEHEWLKKWKFTGNFTRIKARNTKSKCQQSGFSLRIVRENSFHSSYLASGGLMLVCSIVDLLCHLLDPCVYIHKNSPNACVVFTFYLLKSISVTLDYCTSYTMWPHLN